MTSELGPLRRSRKPEAESGRSYGVVVASAEVRSSGPRIFLCMRNAIATKERKKAGPVSCMATFTKTKPKSATKCCLAKKVVDEPVAANVAFLEHQCRT